MRESRGATFMPGARRPHSTRFSAPHHGPDFQGCFLRSPWVRCAYRVQSRWLEACQQVASDARSMLLTQCSCLPLPRAPRLLKPDTYDLNLPDACASQHLRVMCGLADTHPSVRHLHARRIFQRRAALAATQSHAHHPLRVPALRSRMPNPRICKVLRVGDAPKHEQAAGIGALPRNSARRVREARGRALGRAGYDGSLSCVDIDEHLQG